jgi:hypothetical protein
VNGATGTAASGTVEPSVGAAALEMVMALNAAATVTSSPAAPAASRFLVFAIGFAPSRDKLVHVSMPDCTVFERGVSRYDRGDFIVQSRNRRTALGGTRVSTQTAPSRYLGRRLGSGGRGADGTGLRARQESDQSVMKYTGERAMNTRPDW